MKVAHVLAGLDNAAAGTSYSVLRLAAGLAEREVAGEVLSLLPIEDELAARAAVMGFPRFPLIRRLGISPAMRRGLFAYDATLLHNHGLWMMPNIYAGTVARRRQIPLVFSPRGMLSEWSLGLSRWRKRIAWWVLGQRRAVAATDCFHATSEGEAEDIRRLGFRQPIAVISNGIDLPDPGSAEPPAYRGRCTLLFLSRIHPKKGVPILLRAWRRVERHFPDWDLVVAGPDEAGQLSEIQKLARELDLERASFAGPAYDEDKRSLYRRADLFVLPTYSENFGMVIAEALSFGVPVITTKGAPWQELERRACGWWIELSEQNLARALEAAMSLPDERRVAMGRRGRLWMAQSFGWPSIAAEMKSLYQWLLGGGSPPSCVVTD